MNYAESLEYLQNASPRGIRPGLSRIEELLKRLGNPEKEGRFIHIAGTNGKGSTLAFTSEILACEGLKVGRFISPELRDVRECIQSAKGRGTFEMISKRTFAEGVSEISEAVRAMEDDGLESPTRFEILTALAFWYYGKNKCDISVIETGMGGREDSTNVIPSPEVCIITRIGMDHMKFLGDTIADIAGAKAGIIKRGARVVTADQEPDALRVIKAEYEKVNAGADGQGLTIVSGISDAKSCDGTLHARNIKYGLKKQTLDFDGYKKLEISLAGVWQIENACLAVTAVQGIASEDSIRAGLKRTVWPGRLSVLADKPLLIIDGAHNENAASRLAESIEEYFTNKRLIFIMGMLADKECDKVCERLCGYADQIFTVHTPNNPRALPALELANIIKNINKNVTACDSVSEAVEMARLMAGRDDVILAFGSLSYLGILLDMKEEGKLW